MQIQAFARMSATPGQLVIVSGPAGAGKSTVVRELLEQCDLPLQLSVSATTRPRRNGEREGVDYHFLSAEEFERRRQDGEFLECCEVFGKGQWYGTLRSTVTSGLESGKWVILEIDVNGALEVIRQFPDVISIFVRPESFEELERRLRERMTETEEQIQYRLETARRELALADRYRHQITNKSGGLPETVRQICDLLKSYGETSA